MTVMVLTGSNACAASLRVALSISIADVLGMPIHVHKSALHVRRSGPHQLLLLHGFLGPPESTIKTASRSLSRFAGLTVMTNRQTHRHTDRQATSVTIDCNLCYACDAAYSVLLVMKRIEKKIQCYTTKVIRRSCTPPNMPRNRLHTADAFRSYLITPFNFHFVCFLRNQRKIKIKSI